MRHEAELKINAKAFYSKNIFTSFIVSFMLGLVSGNSNFRMIRENYNTYVKGIHLEVYFKDIAFGFKSKHKFDIFILGLSFIDWYLL